MWGRGRGCGEGGVCDEVKMASMRSQEGNGEVQSQGGFDTAV